LHHIAFNVSRATYTQVKKRLDERGIPNSGEVDRGFMYSIYFRDPLGQLYELANYKFDPPPGVTHAEVMHLAHQLRTERGYYNITDENLPNAMEQLVQPTTSTFSADRAPKISHPHISRA